MECAPRFTVVRPFDLVAVSRAGKLPDDIDTVNFSCLIKLELNPLRFIAGSRTPARGAISVGRHPGQTTGLRAARGHRHGYDGAVFKLRRYTPYDGVSWYRYRDGDESLHQDSVQKPRYY